MRPATIERFDDIEPVINRACWCQWWRQTASEYSRSAPGGPGPNAEAHRAALREQCSMATAPGVVAYLGDTPVGWCGFGPRSSMRRLERSRTIPKVDELPVWSVVCFSVRPGYRRRGVAKALLAGAIEYARAGGAIGLEAYPTDPAGTRRDAIFSYTGFTPMFEAAGFRRVVETASYADRLPRWLMRLDLERVSTAPRATTPERATSAERVSTASHDERRAPADGPASVTATPAAATARPATPGDAAAIARIYSEGIEDRIATFETRARSAADLEAWFDGRHPIVVVDDAGGTVVGFAATFEYRPRAAYAGVAEFSVYVARAARGRGVGRLAMEALLAAAEGAALWKLVSRVFMDNEPSRRLLADLGFREVGVYRRHGLLDGRWRDVVIVERLLPAALDETPMAEYPPHPGA